MLTKVELGEKVAEARRLKAKTTGARFTQAMLAETLNLSSSYICDIEKGRKYPNYHLLCRIADACGVLLDFFGDTGGIKLSLDSTKTFDYTKLSTLRGNRSVEEFAKLFNMGARIMDLYEKGLQEPRKDIIEFICETEKIVPDYFYGYLDLDTARKKYAEMRNVNRHTNQINDWLSSPDSTEFVEFAYRVYERGISKDLLRYADIIINIK